MSRSTFGSVWAPRMGFAVGFAFIGAFALIPAVATLGLSFTDISGVPGLPINFVGIENYERFFSPGRANDSFVAIRNTIVFSLAVTVIQNVLAFLVAVLLNRRTRLALFTRSLVFLPTVLGVTIVGLLWSLIFNPIGGPAQSVTQLFGIRSSFFGDPALALGLCIFVQIWMTLGYATVIYMAGLQAIPAEIYESASIDGASAAQKMRLITIPMLAPSITANVLISIIGSLQSFQLIFVLTGAANQATSVLSLLLYRVGFGLGRDGVQEQGFASAVSIIQFVFVAVIALAAFAILRRRENQL